jgi:hypothetical protein
MTRIGTITLHNGHALIRSDQFTTRTRLLYLMREYFALANAKSKENNGYRYEVSVVMDEAL